MTRTILILGIKLCHHPLVLCISTWDWGVDLALTAARTCLLNYLNRCLLDASSQINYPTAGATQPRHTTASCKVHILLLIHNTKGGWQSFMSMGHCQSSSGHYIGNSSILDPSSQITEPPAVFQTCYNVYILLLIHNTKGWWQSSMFRGPISVYFWPLHR